MRFTTRRLTEPTFSALSNEEMLEWLRLDFGDDIITLEILIGSATQVVEHEAGRIIGEATFAIDLSCLAYSIPLHITPLSSVDSVTYIDEDGEEQTLSTDDWYVAALNVAPRLIITGSIPSVRSATITVTAGHSSICDVPTSLRHAIAVLVAADYSQREGAVEAAMMTVKRLCAPLRVWSC